MNARRSGCAQPAEWTRRCPRPLERHELKFIIPSVLVPRVRAFLAPYAEPDAYTAGRPERRYPICSVYYDSPGLRFFHGTLAGERNRVKLRVRYYARVGDWSGGGPAFFEIKRKVNGIVRKARARLDQELARRLIASAGAVGVVADRVDPDARAVLEEFFRLRARYHAHPVLSVQYEREAYESRFGDYVRITFDRMLQAAPAPWPAEAAAGDCRLVGLGGVILEVKFTDSYPRWVSGLIRYFGLQRRSVPKYVLCVRTAGGRGCRLVRASG